jgi:gentisate 1,2-dioxygenase
MVPAAFGADEPELAVLYDDLAAAHLQPLWALSGLLTVAPEVSAKPYRWRADDLAKLARRAGDLVPVDRGGDRRVLAMSNPGLAGAPFVSGTLWAAVQYLLPGESAPPHRHTPAALRFVLDGEGVYTVVDGDPVSMARGDLVLTPSWTFHEHHNPGTGAMMWLDVLDLPLVAALDAVFFEPGTDAPAARPATAGSSSERLWGSGAGLGPAGPVDGGPPAELHGHSPLVAYRWDRTDAALEGRLRETGSGDAVVRYLDPARGGDVMPTMRCEMRRLLAGVSTAADRQTGTRVCAVLEGTGVVELGDQRLDLGPGDVFVVPSWCAHRLHASSRLDVFTTSDAPILQALGLFRREEPAR